MNQKTAVKKLTASDLTFFKWHLENRSSGGKQKAINLNANIFIKSLYPNLPSIIEDRHGTISIDIWIYGPGLRDGYNLQRKIQKKGSYKNYRLNGEFVADPLEEPERFHGLEPGDFVIFNFTGELKPESAQLVFIAAAVEEDALFHSALSEFIGAKSMAVLKVKELEDLITLAGLPEAHPANLLLMATRLEDAALGGIEGVRALKSGPFRGRVGSQALEQARKNARLTGREGEEFICLYLERLKEAGEIKDFVWEADDNAIAPYDFKVVGVDDAVRFVDVKSTRGSFSNRIHISFNELLQMKEETPYDIYRVFNMDEDRASLKVAKDMKAFASELVGVLEELPEGVKADGVSVSPDKLLFGEDVGTIEGGEGEE